MGKNKINTDVWSTNAGSYLRKYVATSFYKIDISEGVIITITSDSQKNKQATEMPLNRCYSHRSNLLWKNSSLK